VSGSSKLANFSQLAWVLGWDKHALAGKLQKEVEATIPHCNFDGQLAEKV
jgi:hypothetical protein